MGDQTVSDRVADELSFASFLIEVASTSSPMADHSHRADSLQGFASEVAAPSPASRCRGNRRLQVVVPDEAEIAAMVAQMAHARRNGREQPVAAVAATVSPVGEVEIAADDQQPEALPVPKLSGDNEALARCGTMSAAFVDRRKRSSRRAQELEARLDALAQSVQQPNRR